MELEAVLLLAPEPTSAGTARDLVERTLSGWGCKELADDARLVITELVSNAVRHARTEMRLVLELRPDAIRVAVTDGAAGDVVRNPDPHTHVGGRGLHIVQELSDRWGVDPADGDAKGKTVWAEWQLPR